MLGFILIYHVGKAFYNLAEWNNKNKWGYAVWGVVSYYIGLFLGSFIVGVIWYYNSPESAENNTSDTVLTLIGIPFGILACWGNYRYLKNKWQYGEIAIQNPDLLDQEI